MNTTAIHNSVRAETYRILSECYKEPCIEFAQDLAEGRLYHELEGNLVRLGISISLDGLSIPASGCERREGEATIICGGPCGAVAPPMPPHPALAPAKPDARFGFAGGGGWSLPYDKTGVECREGEELSDKCGGGGWMISSDRDMAANHLQSLKEIFYPLFVGPSPSIVLPVESVYKVWDREGSGLVPSEARGMLMGDPAIDMFKRYRNAGMEIPAIYKDMPDHLSLLLEYMALLCESGAGEEGEGSQESEDRFLVEHLDWLPELRRSIYAFMEGLPDSGASRFYRTVADITAAFVAHERISCHRRVAI